MKKLLVVLACIALSTAAVAYPGMDSIGIYQSFDNEGAVDLNLNTTAAFEPITLYLCITNPTPGGVSGWEATITIGGTHTPTAPAWTLSAGLDVDMSDEGFQVGIGANPGGDPLMENAQGVVVLATFEGFVMSPTDQFYFLIGGIDGSLAFPDYPSPGYAGPNDAGNLIYLQTSTGGITEPVFCINGACDPQSQDSKSWGEVKSLFR